MKIGMNVWLWTAQLEDRLVPILESLKAIGYDGVEIPVFNLDLDYAAWGKRLRGMELGVTAVTVRNAEDNPISPDAAVRRRGVDATKRAIDCCRAVGATHLVGPFHSALGVFSGSGPTPDEWNWGVESVRAMAEHAGQAGVLLALEPLNRFETYLLNTHDDAARFARQVNHANCRIMYDTFHAHIEEKSIRNALQSAKDMLVHVHISENDRSTPGSGSVQWRENFDALRMIGYQGWLVVEAFGLALPELAAATKIWRRMYESEQQLARDAYQFIKSNVVERWGAI
jgi:D-psicose/D-tagatose/L-ribulose 3-epimerase